MLKDAMLIAETDDQGKVLCVWQADYGNRPKPVRDAAACLSVIDSFGTYGAAFEDIMLWLAQSAAEQS